MMELGQWQLYSLNGGRFWLDAGVMYGIIPKAVWEKVSPPDELNRIPLGIHCVLARDGQHNVLIDAGYGSKLSPLDRASYAADPGDPLAESLAALGVAPGDIDTVVFSHLHWDHAGGATRRGPDRSLVPAFPNATHYVNRLEWQDAVSGSPDLGGYVAEDFEPLEEAGQVVLIEGEVEIVPGLWTRPTGGHTRGHQARNIRIGRTDGPVPGRSLPSDQSSAAAVELGLRAVSPGVTTAQAAIVRRGGRSGLVGRVGPRSEDRREPVGAAQISRVRAERCSRRTLSHSGRARWSHSSEQTQSRFAAARTGPDGSRWC